MTLDKLLEHLLAMRERVAEGMLAGMAPDYPAYREVVGRHRQINEVLQLIEELNDEDDRRANER